MELEAVLRGTKAAELINVPHRARGLLQEFLVNGPGRPAPEQEWPPLQQGVLSRVVRVRFESSALARMGLRRLEEAMLGVVQEDEWSLRPILQEPPGQLEDRAPEWRADLKKFPAAKVDSFAMLLLGGPPLQPPARGGRRSNGARADRRLHEGEHVSDGDTSGYSSSGSEDVEAPASMGTRRADMSWQTTTRGLADRERRSDMAVDDSSRKAAVGQGRKRGAAGSGPGGRRGAGGGGAGAAELTGAVERGFDPRRTHGGGAAGGAGGGGPGGQREICGGGGFWQNDSEGTPEDWDGQQEIDNGSGEDNGGAAEEMDQDGSGVGGLSGRVHPAGWATKTKSQKHKYKQRRRK